MNTAGSVARLVIPFSIFFLMLEFVNLRFQKEKKINGLLLLFGVHEFLLF